MALGLYNGWAGNIREIRGKRQMADIANGSIPRMGHCEICDKRKGLTFHAEEYGSTYEAFIGNLHELCPTCHGILHVRWRYPNRFKRHKQRIAKKEFDQILAFDGIWLFFQALNGLSDIQHVVETKSGIPWLDAIPPGAYKGPPKIALVHDKNGVLVPDPEIYLTGTKVEGVRFDQTTGTLHPYSHG
jgi:hypothetical protein